MVFERYQIKTEKFHCIYLKDIIKNRNYGCFDRFAKQQLKRLCDDLNEENQAAQEYEDFVSNCVIDAIDHENTSTGKKVLIKLAEELGVEYEFQGND